MLKRDVNEFRYEVIPYDDDEIIIIRQPGHSLNMNIEQAKVVCAWLTRHLTQRSMDLLDEQAKLAVLQKPASK